MIDKNEAAIFPLQPLGEERIAACRFLRGCRSDCQRELAHHDELRTTSPHSVPWRRCCRTRISDRILMRTAQHGLSRPESGRCPCCASPLRPHHLERKAILYVRKSSTRQVPHSRESGTLQYAMRDRLTALGWSRIDSIDDNSAALPPAGVARAGYDRMVAEVSRVSAITLARPSYNGPASSPFCRTAIQE